MKKYAPLIVVIGCIAMIAFAHYERSQIITEDLSTQVMHLSERVDLVSYVPEDELWDGEEDDETTILYAGNELGSNFEVEEFIEYDPYASESTREKIRTIHIPELQKVRDNVGLPIIIRSAARSLEWEKKEVGRESQNISMTED